MTEKESQIKLILGEGDLRQWANDQLKPGQKMEDMTYFDFIDITYDEVFSYAMKNGLGPYFKEIDHLVEPINNLDLDQHICVYKKDNRYEVFYTERGQKDVWGVSFSRSEMIEFLVKKSTAMTWRSLTVQYCQKHHPDKTTKEIFETVNLFDK